MAFADFKTSELKIWSKYPRKDVPAKHTSPKVNPNPQLLLAARGISSFPVAVALLVGALGHSANLRIKTFLLIECGMAAVIMGARRVGHGQFRRGGKN